VRGSQLLGLQYPFHLGFGENFLYAFSLMPHHHQHPIKLKLFYGYQRVGEHWPTADGVQNFCEV
jgi:hypothetical protein